MSLLTGINRTCDREFAHFTLDPIFTMWIWFIQFRNTHCQECLLPCWYIEKESRRLLQNLEWSFFGHHGIVFGSCYSRPRLIRDVDVQCGTDSESVQGRCEFIGKNFWFEIRGKYMVISVLLAANRCTELFMRVGTNVTAVPKAIYAHIPFKPLAKGCQERVLAASAA